jgi:hypothetical protein
MDLKAKIRHVPDFPKAGILFYDITTLLQDPAGFRAAADGLSQPFKDQGIDVVVGIESRGSSSAPSSPTGSARAFRRCESPASCRRPAFAQPIPSSTGPTRSRCTRMPSIRDNAC